MKYRYGIPILVLFALVFMATLGTEPCQAAGKSAGNSIHHDGSAFVKESRILQSDRQEAANRAKAKGFKPVLVGAPETPGNTAPNKKEATK